MNLRRFLILGTLAALTACKPTFNAGAFGSTDYVSRRLQTKVVG